jgi:mortality factor 4-like protein 1
MDMQSVQRLKEELSKITNFLVRNAPAYFNTEYETPSQEYVEKARGI